MGDTRGYYQDGAYTAAPVLGPVLPPDASSVEEDKDPQEAYYEALALRFNDFRDNLRLAPPAGAIAALDDRHPISLPRGSSGAAAQWRKLLHSTDPLPAQLAAMDQQTVLSLIKFLVSGLKRGRPIEQRTSRWAWVLLGRLNDAGCLGSEEVGIVRDLGKRAAWLLVRIRQEKEADDTEVIAVEDGSEEEDGLITHADIAEADSQQPTGAEAKAVDQAKSLHRDLETEITLQTASDSKPAKDDSSKALEASAAEASEDGVINEEDQLAVLKERMIARVASTSAETGNDTGVPPEPKLQFGNTVATIDMILTIVGEFYGQRDLLEFRDLWDEEEQSIVAA